MAFKVTAIGHDGQPFVLARYARNIGDPSEVEEKTEVEFDDANQAMHAAVQFSHGSGVKHVRVLNDDGKPVLELPAVSFAAVEAEEQDSKKAGKDDKVVQPAGPSAEPKPSRQSRE